MPITDNAIRRKAGSFTDDDWTDILDLTLAPEDRGKPNRGEYLHSWMKKGHAREDFFKQDNPDYQLWDAFYDLMDSETQVQFLEIIKGHQPHY